MRGRPYYKDQPYDYDERVGALSHSEIILTSREGRRLGLESELNYMGRDLINLAYIMKPLSKAQLSVPGRQYSVSGHLHRAGRGIGHLVSEIYRLSCRTS